MTVAAQYAQALFELVQKDEAAAGRYLENLRALLQARKQMKLLPDMYVQYERLAQRQERMKRYRQWPPERERTRVLLELYRKLTASK